MSQYIKITRNTHLFYLAWAFNFFFLPSTPLLISLSRFLRLSNSITALPVPPLHLPHPSNSMAPFFSLSLWALTLDTSSSRSPHSHLPPFSLTECCGPPWPTSLSHARPVLCPSLTHCPRLAPGPFLPCLLMPACPGLSVAVPLSSPVQREQTELLIISVWQPLFCALIKGAACGLCVSGLCRRRRWPNANITCLIIYVWETGTKAWRGWGIYQRRRCTEAQTHMVPRKRSRCLV